MKIRQHVEIVRSDHVSLSSMSQKSADGVLATLSKYYYRVGVSIVNDLDDLELLVNMKPDLVFLGMKFVPVKSALGSQDPNKVWISDYLDECDIAYTGSSQTAHELEHNKPQAKQQILDAGLDTSPFFEVIHTEPIREQDITLNYPLFIKPSDKGGGVGIDSDSVAYNFEEASWKITSITDQFSTNSLVEEYLPGREFSVAILKKESSIGYFVMPLELIAPLDSRGKRILSSGVKSADSERFIKVSDGVIKSQINQLAMKVFLTLGARDYGRIDIRLDKYGVPQFLEANLIPSILEGYGNFPKACFLNIGFDYEAMILRIVNLGLARNEKDKDTEDIRGPSMLGASVVPST